MAGFLDEMYLGFAPTRPRGKVNAKDEHDHSGATD
jgi:hypothetical protein